MSMMAEIQIYMKAIQFLDETTEDYLYLYDLMNGKIYFTDKIYEKYPLPRTGGEGISVEEWAKIVYPSDRKRLEESLRDIQEGRSDSHNMEYRLIDHQGNRIWINCRGTVQKNETGSFRILIGMVSELALGRKIDNLTGLWNYDKFMEDIGKSLSQGEGYLMVFGIDNFKNINVKNGRTFGNYILKRITDVLEKNAKYPMSLYRLAGDCFAVDFPGKSRDEVLDFYENIKKQLESYCTISAGVVFYNLEEQMDGGAVYQYAESALDRAKKEGKNMLVFFSYEDYRKNRDKIELQDEMKAAVRKGCEGFYLCYQPQIYGKDFCLYGAEALLRYKSKTRGVVSPVEFIPLLEQSGMICQVGAWVLKTAVEQCIEWRKKVPDFHINVNISYVQLRQPEITQMVLNIIREAGLPGEALTLEVTESMQLQDYAYFNRIFYEWKREGIQIAIDDFGTGYSSLSYLKSIDIDETKIDRCFVNRIHYNAYNYRLISNMIELARSARIKVCCEGVETEEELEALQKLNPDVLQGFLFAKPCEKEQFEKIYFCPESEEYRERVEKEKNFHAATEFDNENFLENLIYDDILKNTELGLWKIHIDPVNQRYEMYANPEMRRILGLSEKLPPEECYDYWYHRINEGYYNYINLAVESIIRTGKVVQVEYTWNHPEKGEVTVRCMGTRTKDRNGMICLEGYHRIISNLQRPYFLPGGIQSEMFEYNEKKHTIYFHTQRKLIIGENLREKDFPENWICGKIVHPHFAEKFRSAFQDVQNRENEGGYELMLLTKNSEYAWFRMKTRHMGERREDANTIAVLLEPADQERLAQLKAMRKENFYEALLSETVAHAEVDVESGHIILVGGLWESYALDGDFEETFQENAKKVTLEEDWEEYAQYMNLNHLKETYKKGISTQEYSFRRYVDGQLCWMKLVLHVFQDRYSENMYALLYLKNIDAEKKKEMAQEMAAKRDPLTNIYNRKVFEDEVVSFMSDEGAGGSLILFDMDNFKKVNDEYGHLKGDETLQALSEILQQTFRSHDLIGRLGGDEFVVFVKNVTDKEILDRRMKELFDRMKKAGDIPLACSAGIAIVSEDFDYREELRKADIALYKSKQGGKNQYRYFEN